MTDLLTVPVEWVNEYESQTIIELAAEFRKLDKILDDQDSETRKLIILQKIYRHLRSQFRMRDDTPLHQHIHSTDYKQALLKCAYQFCMVFGFFEKAASSFLFGSNLFSLIPGISGLSLYALTTVYSLLDALLFYAFEVSLLKKAMGVIFTNNCACVLNETYIKQLEAAVEINIFLNRRETVDWDPVTYQQYHLILKHINRHFVKKHAIMYDDYPRSKSRMAVEYGVVIFGAISTVADSYFMAKTAMLALHISFLTSPLACAMVIAMVVSALVFYYAMGARGVAKLVNPDRKSFYKLKEGLTLFCNRQTDLGDEPYVPHGRTLPVVTLPYSPDHVARAV